VTDEPEFDREALEPADPTAAEDRPPLDLTEVALEGLLFVAERPLTRREIATLAGVDRDTVDQRLGDLEVSLAERGIRLVLDGDRVELATAPGAGALVARYVGADAMRSSASAGSTPTTPCARCSIGA
jgi:chromosome segregation and condensation protein ScpB